MSSREAAAAAAAQLAVQELHRGVEDWTQAEAKAGSTRARQQWWEGDGGVGRAAPAQQLQGGPWGRARRWCYGAVVQSQAPARGGTGQGRLGRGGGRCSSQDPPPQPARLLPRSAPRPHLHEHAAVRWDLERPSPAREGILRIR